MNREDIIKLAREADRPEETCWLAYEIDFLERFAALVAAAEREACAKVCLEEAPSLDGQLCAAAIRARGNT